MKTVCFFGIYDREYSRNRVLMRGFRENGWEIMECHADPRVHLGLSKFFELYRKYRALPTNKFDLVLVAFPGHTVVWLARLLFDRHIIFDAFLSLYNSNVEDRDSYSRLDPRAWRDFFLDWYSCHLAFRVLLDTNAHISYFIQRYLLSRKKFLRVLVGAEPIIHACFFPDATHKTIFHGATSADRSVSQLSHTFLVHFHGSGIPLQGIATIFAAALHLRNEPKIHFRLVGKGEEFDRLRREAVAHNLTNVTFCDPVFHHELISLMLEADICLGIFGTTSKTDLVIPNKVYEAVAAGKPTITADSPAVREIFQDRENIFLVPAGNAKALACQIQEAFEDQAHLVLIGKGAGALFQQLMTPQRIVAGLLRVL